MALAAQLVVLAPIARTPFWGDDAANSYTTGYLRWGAMHWWAFFWASNKAQLDTFGRPIPLGVLQTYGLFDVLHNRLAYKLLLIALTLLASALLATVARQLRASPAAAALFCALPATVWQLHLLHDALLSYAGLSQALVIYAAGAALAFVGWLRRGGWWRAALVVLLSACGCLTYESGYLLPIALVLVAWCERRCSLRRAVVLAWPGLSVTVAFVLLAALLSLGLSSASGYHPSRDLGSVFVAWAKIITSGLPIIGWAASSGPRMLAPASWTGPIERGALTAVLLVPLLLAATRGENTHWTRDRRTVVAIAGIAAALLLTPSLLTALAPQYQRVLLWGWGYLPMFFAGLGWAMLGAIAVSALLTRLAPRPRVAGAACAATALLAGAAVAVNSQANARVVQYMAPVARSRSLIEAGFKHGVLNTVPTFSTVLWYVPDVALPFGTWAPGAFNMEAWTREFVNRPLTMHLIYPTTPSPSVCSDASGTPGRCAIVRTPTFWLRTQTSGSRGFVALTEPGVRRWTSANNTLAALTRPGAQPTVFVQDPRISAHGGTMPFHVTVATPAPAAVAGRQLDVLRRGAGWALVRLPPQRRFIATSLGVTFD